MVAVRLVEEQGYMTRTAYNGKEAISCLLECAREGISFRLILMDLQMPIMDGFETSKVIRTLQEEKKIDKCPIVALSANSSEEDKRRCIEAGMDELCAKPLMEDVLRKVLSKYGY